MLTAKGNHKSLDSNGFCLPNEKYNYFRLILWYDTTSYNTDNVLSLIRDIDKSNVGNQFAYILHDKDFDENYELKKFHYHVVLYFKNQRSTKSVLKYLGLPSDFKLLPCDNYYESIKYLIHQNGV